MLVTAALTILTFYTSISGLFKAELFPSEIRALGIGLAHSIASGLFGGSAEFIALHMKQSGIEWAFGWYVSAVCLASFVVILRMPKSATMLIETRPPHEV